MSMNEVLGVRLRKDERKLVHEAASIEMQLGDRGGASSWARRVLLREAKRVVDAAATKGSK